MIGGIAGVRRRWSATVAATGWGESTFAELAWDKSRFASRRWAIVGAIVGTLIGLIVFAPAAWLASAVARATDQRILLAEARGTVWSGSAVPVLTGGADSRDATSLPGRLEWTLRWKGLWFELAARHACCIDGQMALQVRPGLGRMSVTLMPSTATGGWIAQWPSAWLGGLGTPFNSLQLGGALKLSSPGLVADSAGGRWRLNGRADLDVLSASSRLSTLDTLGSYRLSITGDGVSAPQILLTTTDGALQLSGSGEWGAGGVRFRGQALAAPLNEPALSNLLNIIGRREGARSVISIG